MALLDIILVNYNSTDHLLCCLSSIFEDLGDVAARIMVEDNGSQDDVRRVKALFPVVRLRENRANLGFSKAVNRAVGSSSSEYLLILNPDTHVGRGFFRPMLEYMAGHTDVGVMGPAVRNADGSLQGSARAYPSPLTAFFGRSSIISRWFPNNPITTQNILTMRSDGLTPMEVDWVSGACMVIRRAVLREVGPLDERFFMYWEDADWCRRYWAAGWKVVYFPGACITHYVGISSAKNPFRSALEFHKSSYRLFEKYASPSVTVLKPLVIGGLSLRILPILLSGGIQALSGTRKEMPRVAGTAPQPGRIRVLRMIARLNIGGPAIHVHLLSQGLDPGKFESTVVSGRIPAQEGDMGYLFRETDKKPLVIPYLQREISMAMDLRSLIRIFKILRTQRPQIVHSHTAKAGFNARLAVSLYNFLSSKRIKMVHTFHGHVFHGYFSRFKSQVFVWIERVLARKTDVIIAISETQRKELSERYRIAPPQKIRTIGLGFDLDPFLQCSTWKGRFRSQLGIDPQTLLIGIIGRLVPIKNHRMFLDAAKCYLEEDPDAPVSFIVVGDGELREELEAYCRKQGLSGHTRFTGWIKDVPMIYADLDMLALTSQNEGTPVSIIEAMASSVPVIATDAGGVRDLLGKRGVPSSDGYIVAERGVLCGKEDSGAFAKGMRYLAGLDPMERRKGIQRARSFVAATYSKERLLKDIETLYEELTRGDIFREEEDRAFGYSRKTDTGHRWCRADRLPRGGRAA